MARCFTKIRLQHLEQTSQALLTSSPSISAHLRLVRNEAVEAQDVITEESSLACTACGNILIKGWSCKVVNKTSFQQSRKDRIAKVGDSAKTYGLKCSRCDAVTTVKRQNPGEARTSRKPSAVDSPEDSVSVLASDVMSTPSQIPTASRRRSRKKADLQTILANQEKKASAASNGFNFDLKDLMKI